jgi:hypothetical protein
VIYVDTGAWFATFVPNDPDHAAADAWLEANIEPLVTTDYVVDERLTLLKIRGEFQRAMRLGASLFAREIAHVEWVMPDDVRQAWAISSTGLPQSWPLLLKGSLRRLHSTRRLMISGNLFKLHGLKIVTRIRQWAEIRAARWAVHEL